MSTATLTLTEFLLARIADDEAVARDVWTRPHFGECDAVSDDGDRYDCDCTYPARVLAECEAKRAIVADYEQAGMFLRMSSADNIANMTKDLTLFRVVKVLASVYADHPDYPYADPA